jgi:hypothetical protein
VRGSLTKEEVFSDRLLVSFLTLSKLRVARV